MEINTRKIGITVGATMTLYLSIWAGLIIVGNLLGISGFQTTLDSVCCGPGSLYADPVAGATNLIINALANPAILISLGISGLAAGIIAGGNFGTLFVVPFAVGVAVMQLFLLPTGLLIDESIPDIIKATYVTFIGLLTVLTLLTFTAGRS